MKNKTKRVCQACGKHFYGPADYHYCPVCAKAKKLDTVVKLRACKDCGVEFFGFARHGRALTGVSPEHAQVVGNV